MATGLQKWSTTAASNNSADSAVNWAEGQAPSSVNDSARAEMASAAKFRDDNNGTLVTSGSTTAYTVTSNQVSTGNTNGYTVSVEFHATNDSSATLAQDGNSAAPLQLYKGTNLAGGEFVAGAKARFTYTSSSTSWVLHGYVSPGSQANIINTANIAAAAVTYAKIQNETAGTILGNGTGSPAAPQELVVGTGLSIASGAISAPAFPPTSAFKNLSIKVASTTTITGAADFATMATSGSSQFYTMPLTGTINMASTGVVNGLDQGALAGTTVYAIYGIASTTSTAGGWLASTSFTTPLMPTGYNIKARLGAVVTTTTTGTPALYGTWQFGRQVQYVSGLAGTTKPPVLVSGNTGTWSASSPTLATISTTPLVPSSASAVKLLATSTYTGLGGGAQGIIVAPSTAYSGTNNGPQGSNGLSPPLIITTSVNTVSYAEMILESSNVYVAMQNDTHNAVQCLGWIDNI